jgi:hypothetical protein
VFQAIVLTEADRRVIDVCFQWLPKGLDSDADLAFCWLAMLKTTVKRSFLRIAAAAGHGLAAHLVRQSERELRELPDPTRRPTAARRDLVKGLRVCIAGLEQLKNAHGSGPAKRKKG